MSTSQILIYLTPIMTGLIGWVTNWVAVKMLFKPEKPVRIVFFTIQGIFPKRQQKLAERIGRMVADELLTSHDIKQKLMNEENLVALKLYIAEKVDDYLHTRFPEKYPLASVFIGRNRRERLKVEMLEEVDRLAPDVIEKIIQEMETRFDIEEMIANKVAKLSPSRLEQLIQGILKKEFVFIEWIGGILGFFVGLVQVVVIEIIK